MGAGLCARRKDASGRVKRKRDKHKDEEEGDESSSSSSSEGGEHAGADGQVVPGHSHHHHHRRRCCCMGRRHHHHYHMHKRAARTKADDFRLHCALGRARQAEGALTMGREHHRVEVDVATTSGYQGLHAAASHGHVETVQLLLNQNAQVDAATKAGMTALMFAATGGHTEVVRLLLDKKADQELTTKSVRRERRARDFAIGFGHDELAALLGWKEPVLEEAQNLGSASSRASKPGRASKVSRASRASAASSAAPKRNRSGSNASSRSNASLGSYVMPTTTGVASARVPGSAPGEPKATRIPEEASDGSEKSSSEGS